LFDIDGTLTSGGEVWAALIHSPYVSRLKKGWLYASGMPHYLISKVGIVSQAGFRDRWVRLMAWLMAGWHEPQARAHYDQIMIEGLLPMLRADVLEVLKQHQASGHPVILVSTMFEGIVQGFAAHIGADAGLGTRAEFRDGRCTGRVIGETCSGGRKVEFARRYLQEHHAGVSLDEVAAYADSRSDIPFLAGAGYPVATYPDDAMRAAALDRGWAVYEGGE
jgi:putative phosphoserine phosphatase/1-acylglycerol-3-phosphate O-acyltransferase